MRWQAARPIEELAEASSNRHIVSPRRDDTIDIAGADGCILLGARRSNDGYVARHAAQ